MDFCKTTRYFSLCRCCFAVVFILTAISACNANTPSGGDETVPIAEPSLPTNFVADAKVIPDDNQVEFVSLKWSEVPGASYYRISIYATTNQVSTQSEQKRIRTIDNWEGTQYKHTELHPSTTYRYNLQACNTSGCSDDKTIATVTTAPRQSIHFTAVADNESTITLRWKEIPGATKYRLYTSEQDAQPKQVYDTTVKIQHEDTGLSAGTTYYYWLEACNASGCSDSEKTMAITWPATPSDFTAKPGDNYKITLGWDKVTGAEKYFLYVSEQDTKPQEKYAATAKTQHDHTGLSAGTTYYYWLEACNASGCSDSKKTTAITWPATPSDFIAKAKSDNTITIDWQKVEHATKYRLFSNTVDTRPDTALKDNLARTTTTYTHTPLDPGTRHYYWLMACSASGCSEVAQANAITLLAAPKNFVATAKSDSRIVVQWDSVDNTAIASASQHYSTQVEMYHLYSSAENSNAQDKTYDTVSPDKPPRFVDTGLSAGTRYYYWLRACNADVCSVEATANAITFPKAPQSFTATANSASEIRLDWEPVVGADSYRLYASTDNNKPADPTKDTSSDETEFLHTGLDMNTQYNYWLVACNADVCSVEATANAITFPAVPENFTATANSASEIRLDWDPVVGADSYRLYASTDNNKPADPTKDTSSDETEFLHTGLHTNTQYYYWLVACIADVCSVDVIAQDVTLLTAPENFRAEFDDDVIQITLYWDSVSGASDYKIYRSEDGSKPTNPLDNPQSTFSTDGTETDGTYVDEETISFGTTYNYWIEACNTNGCSVSSFVKIPIASIFNDTGLTWGANAVNGNNATCSSDVEAHQDCHQGRDAKFNDNSDGHAGFRFTKLASDGKKLAADALYWQCVQDDVTGLVWENKTTTKGLHNRTDVYTWYSTDSTNNGGVAGNENTSTTCHGYTTGDPQSYCNTQAFAARVNAKKLCGYDDWRVPEVSELHSIVSYHRDDDAPSIDSAYFPATQSTIYWTSTPTTTNAETALVLNFHRGYSDVERRKETYRVRLVRGKSSISSDVLPKGHQVSNRFIKNYWPDSRYIDRGDGTVLDRVTGLMWKKCSEGLHGEKCEKGQALYSNWKVVLERAQGVAFAGYDDWRVPNIKELSSLVMRNASGPSLNISIFPNPPLSQEGFSIHWSSTPNKNSPTYSPCLTTKTVDFFNVIEHYYFRCHPGFVRLVRGG